VNLRAGPLNPLTHPVGNVPEDTGVLVRRRLVVLEQLVAEHEEARIAVEVVGLQVAHLVTDHVLQRTDAGQVALLGAQVVHEVEVGTQRQAQEAGHDARDDDGALVHPAAWAMPYL